MMRKPVQTIRKMGRFTQVKLGLGGLLACLVAACQPAEEVGGEVAADAEQASIEAGASSLAKFQVGDLEKLDFSMDSMRLPVTEVLDSEGNTQTLAQYAGKVVVLNFWGEWCPPCVEEMPTLATLQEVFADEDVVVVPVALGDEDSLGTARDKLTELVGDTLPFLYDSSFEMTAEAQTGAFPSTMIYDREGVEVARLVWPADWASENVQGLIRAVLAGES